MKNQRMRTLQKKIYKYKIFINTRYTDMKIPPGVKYFRGCFSLEASFIQRSLLIKKRYSVTGFSVDFFDNHIWEADQYVQGGKKPCCTSDNHKYDKTDIHNAAHSFRKNPIPILK